MYKIENVKIVKNGAVSDGIYDIICDNNGFISDIPIKKESGICEVFAVPGYIDTHTHGGYGKDYFECTQEAADAVGKFHLDNGTTSFVATSVATPLDELDNQLKKIRLLENRYASMLGVHTEGPFISVKKKGAQPEKNIKSVFEPEDAEFFRRNKDILRTVTMCPGVGNARLLTECLIENGIIAHAGHDDSIYPEIMCAVDAGLSGVTHLYCASSGLGRRKGDLTKYIGLNETALLTDELFTEVIADDVHISEMLFKLIYKNKGYRKMCAVSDSLSAAGMPVGDYMLGQDVEVYNNGNVVLLKDRSALAGSVTPLSKMVKIMVSYGIPLAEAVFIASEAPATHLGITDRGEISVGKRFDINLIDKDGNLLSVYKGGVRYK